MKKIIILLCSLTTLLFACDPSFDDHKTQAEGYVEQAYSCSKSPGISSRYFSRDWYGNSVWVKECGGKTYVVFCHYKSCLTVYQHDSKDVKRKER